MFFCNDIVKRICYRRYLVFYFLGCGSHASALLFFIKGTNNRENGLRFKDWIESLYDFTDAGYSYPAGDSAPQGKREPLESHE